MEKLSLTLDFIKNAELREMGALWGVAFPGSWKKARMIERLGELYLEKPEIVLEMMGLESVRLLNQMTEACQTHPDRRLVDFLVEFDGDMMNAVYGLNFAGLLDARLLLKKEDAPTIADVCSDFFRTLSELSRTRGERLCQLDRAEKCVEGMLLCYGLLPEKRLLDMLADCFDELPRDELDFFMRSRLSLEARQRKITGNDGERWWSTDAMLDSFDWIDWLKEQTARYKRFDKSELIDIAERGYAAPRKTFDALLQSFVDNGVEPDEARLLICDLLDDEQNRRYDVGSRELEALSNVEWASEAAIRRAMYQCIDLLNGLARWVLFGYSPNEKMGEKREQTAFTMSKIGRNDPCPCGSGKKFKHCCGKRIQ